MKKQVLDNKGKKVEEINLHDEVFKIEPNNSVLAQYIRVYTTNQRTGTSKVKNKAEVAGGGAKPWRQKGTGRARAGSSRSPIWVHGGVTHGPLPKDWTLKLPKKMKKLAMRSALSLKETGESLFVVNGLGLEKISTSAMSGVLKTLGLKGSVLYVWNKKDDNVMKSISNLTKIRAAYAGSLNPYDLIAAKTVLFEKDAILDINERFKK
ncbi:MAG: 50S ribosomal protein L4 [candidate division WWE3 bacterium GW2011_GWF2_41_45]|uniref:Large ribosomal subunit protein uL4 n=3 Tax=Katanobacteria TaxID=422282 RepID=A0A1F4W3H1_UNCKA|nr:MAG: 50S ribosomal protein L4 [candidate division WWE3 bacterium GW2011_GWC2_41_23]KKS10752.1 MAG: 50S ribosomal protein L4 [candidate division WWE3 bacterium GW2011_GWF2_41_45]KKS12428.1 MAG: 50S ribosomal protein L4 [candidate division WWE3 bacterium GW2011_GWF1_41_53]KKS20193.1 MAG: 50S ribosomal protein L4 [candidate division WWE3 bacterium GW2011_GWE1_41_72]KKS28370.1 MAG: 50S ribosomal protein L4 [candidate division WWE3 bacterium GW2011_GWC1_42_102]KKS29590.1 MAG: 50S ribosomal prote